MDAFENFLSVGSYNAFNKSMIFDLCTNSACEAPGHILLVMLMMSNIIL